MLGFVSFKNENGGVICVAGHITLKNCEFEWIDKDFYVVGIDQATGESKSVLLKNAYPIKMEFDERSES